MTRLFVCLLAVAVGLWAALISAAPEPFVPPPEVRARTASAMPAPLADDDRALLLEADRELAYEKAAAILGIQRSSDVALKRLAAEQLQQAHDATRALAAVAEQRGLQLSHRITTQGLEAIEQLVRVPPPQFDRSYVEDAVARYQRQAERLDQARRASRDLLVRWWSAQALRDRLASRDRVARWITAQH